VTLRLFRRKTGAAAAGKEGTPAAARSSGEARTRPARGRSRATTAGRAAPTEPAPAAAQTKPSGRTRRGRRGGARKKAQAGAAPALAPAAPEPEAPPPRPAPKGEAGTLEAILARHEATLSELMDRQLAALKGVQGSLSAIENRLGSVTRAGGDRSRVAVFVDVPNVMYAAERVRTSIDYGKMLGFLVHGRELVRAAAYAPISDDPMEPVATQRFVQPFIGRGYSLVTKPLKRYADGSIKANFDVELAIDILTMSDRLDTVVLVSGDGDFRRLVELVESKGVRVEVAAFGDSTAAELRNVADEYVDLKDHLAELRPK
jgi:uncharacterized LabA/DUF88 family protein